MRPPPPGILAVTPGDHGITRDLAPWLQALGEAGLRTVVLREPQLSPEDFRALVQVAHRHIPVVVLHARNQSARQIAARLGLGLHLPSHADPSLVRGEISGLLGSSCHHRQEVDAALEGGADYVFLSPVWRPKSKPRDRRAPLGRRAFLSVAVGRPVYALGGVTPERWEVLQAHGVHGAAVSGGLFQAADPEEAAQRLRAYRGVLQKGKSASS